MTEPEERSRPSKFRFSRSPPSSTLERRATGTRAGSARSTRRSVDALEAFRHNPNAFDLVITDMTMPNMTGAQLIKEVMEIRPDMPTILCTGFSEKMSPEKATVLGIKGYLMKPIIKNELAVEIRKALAACDAILLQRLSQSLWPNLGTARGSNPRNT